MSDPQYQIGQVIYVALKRDATIVPMQVIEVITKQTLNGDETNYLLRAGAEDSPASRIMLNELDGEVFDSPERAKAVLVDRATKAISKIVDNAVERSKTWYPGGKGNADPLSFIKKPSTPSGPRPGNPVDDLKRELEAEAASSDASILTLPDGTKAKIKSIKMPDAMS